MKNSVTFFKQIGFVLTLLLILFSMGCQNSASHDYSENKQAKNSSVLRGESIFTMTEDGEHTKFWLNIPEEIVLKANGVQNLETLLAVTGPDKRTREVTLSIEPIDSPDEIYLATAILENYQYETINYRITFSDLSKGPKKHFATCATRNVQLSGKQSINSCPIAITKAAPTTLASMIKMY